MGKATGKDAAAGKQTMVRALGMERAQGYLELLTERALAALERFGPEADGLRNTARYFADAEELSDRPTRQVRTQELRAARSSRAPDVGCEFRRPARRTMRSGTRKPVDREMDPVVGVAAHFEQILGPRILALRGVLEAIAVLRDEPAIETRRFDEHATRPARDRRWRRSPPQRCAQREPHGKARHRRIDRRRPVRPLPDEPTHRGKNGARRSRIGRPQDGLSRAPRRQMKDLSRDEPGPRARKLFGACGICGRSRR